MEGSRSSTEDAELKGLQLQRIWVICGGPTTEYEVSLKSAQVVCQNISLAGRKVRPVVVKQDGRWLIWEDEIATDGDRSRIDGFFLGALDGSAPEGIGVAEALARLLSDRVDCVFIAIHGQFGEDGRLQGFLETAGVPYTGSGVLASATAFHKGYSLSAFRLAGLRVPKGVLIQEADGLDAVRQLKLPVFVKPVCGGSSVGLTLVRDWSELEGAVQRALDVDGGALVEERIEGTELSCGVLDFVEDGRIVSRALPPTEIRPVESDYFDYDAKYTAGKSREITPPALAAHVIERIQECAFTAHKALGCEGMSRTDMFLSPGETEPVVLETNTIPGLTPTSLLPQQAAAVGINVPALFDILIENAIFRAETATKARTGV